MSGYFFFQAEDGIRDIGVTGVQTCALPISPRSSARIENWPPQWMQTIFMAPIAEGPDRKSTRLNSSHANISYAVFCLKKKKTNIIQEHTTCNQRAFRAESPDRQRSPAQLYH